MRLLFALLFATTFVVAQTPEVPHKMQFADLTLTIRDDARKEIQKDVDAYTKYPKSFLVKVERAKTYFPIIEKIFAEENVPDDLKYLVIQESALIPDAVSVSNAVGFWQFKDFTGIEMGLRIDKEVDERMNIVASSRAAARYLKKNNTFFNNWLYALQAYQMGAGGVMRSEKDTRNGVKHLTITSSTYWYVKKYLAHKIAYEHAITGDPEVKIITYNTQSRKSLADIAREVVVDEQELRDYNKWLKGSQLPGDRAYAVAIPIKSGGSLARVPKDLTDAPAIADASRGLQDTAIPKGSVKRSQDRMKINGVQAIRGQENETPTKLAARAGVDLSAFLKWNDLSITDRIDPSQYYFLAKKRTRATTAYHKVEIGESLWAISQRHGVQLKKLKKFNRLQREEDIQPGVTLWLAGMKPRETKGVIPAKDVVEVDNRETFAWESAPVAAGDKKPIPVQTSEVKVSQPDPMPEVPHSLPEETKVEEKVESSQTLPDQTDAISEVIPETTETLKVEVPVTPGEHIVQQKETLYGIARQYNIGVMDLVKWNNIELQQGIKPGQVLKVMEPQPLDTENVAVASPENIEHVVKPSDTVYSIARKYGVTIKELMDWNNKKDFNLAVGEKLKIVRK